MNWLQKTASPEEYLSTLGAPPETIQWIISQPDSQFYINEYRKNPGTDVSTLQPPQKRQHEPTRWELDQARWYAKDDPRHQWILVQLRKMRTTSTPARTVGGHNDYSYVINSGDIQQKTREIDDWFEINMQNGTPVDIASYTWEQAVAASNEWHAVSAGQGAGKIYEPTNSELIMFRPQEWEGWSVQKVISENDLLVEGNRMNHCVGDYCRQVQKGATEIYSLRDPKNEPHVTIEIDPQYNEIVQIMGNSNTEPDDAYKVYIKQWFDELQKERPGLKLGGDDAFDFDFSYVENSDIDDEINRIVYQGNEYGLKTSLDELDIENAYDAVIHELTKSSFRSADTRYVGHIGPALARAAWEADKYRANKFGIIDPETANEKYIKFDLERRLAAFRRESASKGVQWLWYKTEKNNESFYNNFDFFESYFRLEDFESEEEYEKAQDEERNEAEREVRSNSLPYALDDEIVNTLSQLAKEDPFLPDTPGRVASSNWLKRIAQQDLPHTSIGAYGRYFETGVPVEFRYVRNNERAPDFGSRYQQDIEPAGRYLTHNEDPGSEDYLAEMKRRGWEYGLAKFENPLVITFNTKNQINYDEHSWKATLSRKFGGFTGEALARAIVGQGYDGIVTVHANDKGEPLYVSEIVDLTGFIKQAQKAMPLPVVVDNEERLDNAGILRIDNKMTEDTANRLRQQYPEIEYGGAGAIGIAFQTGPNEIMKVTHDLSEANAAEYAFEHSLNWVVPILEKPQMIQDNPPIWSIRMKKLQPIEDPDLVSFVHSLVDLDKDDRFPDPEQVGFMVENNFSDPNDMDEALNIYAHIKYILDQNRQALWLGDIHGGNVGWDDDGNLKVFDLGPGNWAE